MAHRVFLAPDSFPLTQRMDSFTMLRANSCVRRTTLASCAASAPVPVRYRPLHATAAGQQAEGQGDSLQILGSAYQRAGRCVNEGIKGEAQYEERSVREQ